MELVEKKEESKAELRSSMRQILQERLLKRKEEGKSNRSTQELAEERRRRLKSLTTPAPTLPPPIDEENPFVEEENTSKSLVRKQDHLVAGDLVAATVASTTTLALVSFQVLCLSDQQCVATEDPAVSPYTQCVIPLIVVVLLSSATSSNTKAWMVTSSLMFLIFLAFSLERDHELRTVHFRRTARRSWRECEETASNGVWKFSRCDYPNSARVFYQSHENLAEKMRRNVEHVLYITIATTVNFGLASFASAYVLMNREEPSRREDDDCCCEFGDCLRLRPRLVRR